MHTMANWLDGEGGVLLDWLQIPCQVTLSNSLSPFDPVGVMG